MWCHFIPNVDWPKINYRKQLKGNYGKQQKFHRYYLDTLKNKIK